MTAVLYLFGTLAYLGLIRGVERKELEIVPDGNPETERV